MSPEPEKALALSPADLKRRLASEALGTMLLAATVVGSGIMADNLSDDSALILLGNTLPTGAMLVVLIALLGPVSGAHFNPVVSLILALRRELPVAEAVLYAPVQVLAACLGTMLAQAMFGLPLIELSERVRSGPSQWLAEAVASFGLVFVVLAAMRLRTAMLPALVGLYIAAAYWFTASTSFANPAIAFARALTNSFSGIRMADVPAFAVAEVAGGLVAMVVTAWLFGSKPR